MLSVVGIPVFVAIPRLFLQAGHSSSLLGVYSALSLPSVVISVAASVLMLPLIPKLAEYGIAGDKKSLSRVCLLVSFSIGLVGLGAAIAGWQFGDTAMGALYGPFMRGFSADLAWIMVSAALGAISLCLANVLLALRFLGLQLAATSIGIVAVFGLAAGLVPSFGMEGAIIAQIIAQGAQICVGFVFVGYAIRRCGPKLAP
jgi:O-antigen/teichoic acid export membrane protein